MRYHRKLWYLFYFVVPPSHYTELLGLDITENTTTRRQDKRRKAIISNLFNALRSSASVGEEIGR